MATLKAVLTLGAVSGLPKDNVVNVLHFTGDPAGDLTAGIAAPIVDFLSETPTDATHPVQHYLSGWISRADNACSIKVYEMPATGTPIGSPIFEHPFGLLADGDSVQALPNEVALCLSFAALTDGVLESGPSATDIPTDEAAQDQGAPATHTGTTRPKARTRGRIYLGPLNYDATNHTSGLDTPLRPLPAFMTLIAEQAEAKLKTESHAAGYDWCVWSQRDLAARFVTHGWVDNEFDTQRRRGITADSRATFG